MAVDSDDDSTFIPGRKLCPDGNCVGIIAGDGKCTVCGLSVGGAEVSPAQDSPTSHADVSDVATDFEATQHSPEDSASGFDPNRRLCGDDTCVGVIGEDNRCRVCGKPAVDSRSG